MSLKMAQLALIPDQSGSMVKVTETRFERLISVIEQLVILLLVRLEQCLDQVCNAISPVPVALKQLKEGDGELVDELCHLVFADDDHNEKASDEATSASSSRACAPRFRRLQSVFDEIAKMEKFSQDYYSDDAIFGVIDAC